ncbi:MAG: hypothetical protein WCV84_05900 [Patescibacteria group bacterium]
MLSQIGESLRGVSEEEAMMNWMKWVLFVALVGCLGAELDQNGAIRCGPPTAPGQAEMCPLDWVCRFGRCCPQGTTEAACPNLPGTVGSACTSQADCHGEDTASCLTSAGGRALPGGYCVRLCMTRGDVCGDGLGICAETPLGLRCMRACTPGTWCRGPGYTCRSEPGLRLGICVPE